MNRKAKSKNLVVKPTPGAPAEETQVFKTRHYKDKEKRKKGHDKSCPFTVGKFEIWAPAILVVVMVGVFGGAF
jgi:hypothetical protein